MRNGKISRYSGFGIPAFLDFCFAQLGDFVRHDLTPKSYGRLYLFLALPMLLALNVLFPAFHAPDDYDHAKRASTLISGNWLPTTLAGRSSGSLIDSGLIAYIQAQTPIVEISNRPLSQVQLAEYRRDHAIRWSGHQEYSEAPGAMSYMPLLYAPQALALAITQQVGTTVETSILVARLVNSLAGALLVALGLRLLPAGHAIVIVLMLLPKSLLQFASNSADPILYGATVTLVAMGIRIWQAPQSPALNSAAAALLCFIVSTVRPPLAALGLPFALGALRKHRWFNLALITLSILAVSAWFISILPLIVDLRCGEVGARSGKIAAFVLHWPELIGRSILAHHAYYLASFIGELGWGNGPLSFLDRALPTWAYMAAAGMLGLAYIEGKSSPSRLSFDVRILLFFIAIIMILLVFFAMYAGCTSPGAVTIGGVQGRYFVPSIVAIAPALAGAPSHRARAQGSHHFPLILVIWCVVDLTMLCFQAKAIYV
jgi:hypothetical protein